jgi:hypothetical protein
MLTVTDSASAVVPSPIVSSLVVFPARTLLLNIVDPRKPSLIQSSYLAYNRFCAIIYVPQSINGLKTVFGPVQTEPVQS